jgi:hypothetical protein
MDCEEARESLSPVDSNFNKFDFQSSFYLSPNFSVSWCGGPGATEMPVGWVMS